MCRRDRWHRPVFWKHFQSRKLSRHCDSCPVDQPTRPISTCPSVCLLIYFWFLSVSDDRIIPNPRAHIFILIFSFSKNGAKILKIWIRRDRSVWGSFYGSITIIRSPPKNKGRMRAIRCPASFFLLWWWWWCSALVCHLHAIRCYIDQNTKSRKDRCVAIPSVS